MADTAKSTRPRASRKFIRREALMARLVEARRQRCVVVLGQAGGGKTSTLQAWRQELMALGFDVAWLSLAPEHDQLQRFLPDLVGSIASIDATIVNDVALLTEGVASEAEAENWTLALVKGMGSRPRELVLMLDDLHHVRDPRIFRTIQWLLDYGPEGFHLALSSRSALPLSFERLRSRSQVTELDMRDLRFSAEESERYLREQLGSIDAGDALALHELTDGWIAGLQLFALDLRAREGVRDAGYAPVRLRDARAFASYFEREVLVRIAPEDMEMLTRASVCNRFCVPLCASMLTKPQPLSGVRGRLAKLVEDNFFIVQMASDEREPWFRFHPLLRETLLARLSQWPAEERRLLHVAAGRWFGARGDLDEAVHHAVQSGDIEQAVALVEAHAHDLLSSGELLQLAQLLRQLPGDAIVRHFDLHLAQAYLTMYARDVEGCEASLRQMEARCDELDAGQRYNLLLLRCGLAAQQDRIDEVIDLVPALRDIPADAKDLAWTSRANLLAWAHLHAGDYAQARLAFDESQRRSGAQLSALLGRCMMASILRRQGRLSEAELLAREVLRATEQRGSASGGVACMAAAVLADILYEIDDVEAAQALLEPRMAAIERLTLPGVVLRAFATLAGCYWLSGREAEALAAVDRLEVYARHLRLDRILAQALKLKLRYRLYGQEMREAVEVLERMQDLTHLFAGDRAMAARIGDCLARARCDMALGSRDFAAARRLLEERGESIGRGFEMAPAELEFQRALACFGAGAQAVARAHLLAGLRVGHDLGLVRSVLDVSIDMPMMLRALLPDEGLEPVLRFYAKRLEAAAERKKLKPGQAPAQVRPASVAPMTVLSEREYEVLSLVAQAMPNKKIARMLDVTLDTVKFHLKNIYGKLGVAARDEAVARLRDLEAGREAARDAS